MRFADLSGGILGSVGHQFGLAGNVAENAYDNPAAAFGLIGAATSDVAGGGAFGLIGNLTGNNKPLYEEFGLPGFD